MGQGALSKMDESMVDTFMDGFRQKHGCDVMLLAMKDQNNPGKLCLSGHISKELTEAISGVIKTDPENAELKMKKDKYDGAYTQVWRHANLTTGHSAMSLQKNYFPKGTLWVKLLDTIAQHGWSLSAAPNFGGVESRDDKGNVVSTVDWPVFVFYKDKHAHRYTNDHLLLAVKDANIPGKLCAAGDVGDLGPLVADALNALEGKTSDPVECKKDKYDDDFDLVWRNTKITTGAQAMSLTKSYFPRGHVVLTVLEKVYSRGWRLIACPNFGGRGDSWPAFVFRKLKNTKETPPQLVIAALKDSNKPGKLCLAGTGDAARSLAEPLIAALRGVKKNESVCSDSDSYDKDFDVYLHNVNITTGHQAFSLKVPYFPRADSMGCLLKTFSEHGFLNVGCPNFGGMLDSWPVFILEQTGQRLPTPIFWAIKDDNIPGKINFLGQLPASFPTQLLAALQALNGENVALTKDKYDANYDYCFKHTFSTSGNGFGTMTKPFFPHGCVIEAVCSLLLQHGWQVCAGPNFGDDGGSWPSFVCQPVAVCATHETTADPSAPPSYNESQQ